MITREQIHAAEAQAASHAIVFQIRASEYDATPEDRPIARAIAGAALRRERAALAWAGERLAVVRKYAAYEGIAGETRPQAPQPFTPAIIFEEQAAPVELEQAPPVLTIDTRSVQCPKCGAGAGERCSKQGRPQTRNHDARTRAAIVQAPAISFEEQAAPVELEQAPPVSRRRPGGADNSRSGRFMQAREEAKHTPPELRTAAQNALIQYPNVYGRTLETDRALKAAESTGHTDAIEYARAAREDAHAAHDRTYRLAYSAV